MYIRKLVGKRIYLSPINPDDYEKFALWINDNEIGIFTGRLARPISFDGERDALHSMSLNSHVFAIVDGENDEAIGVVSFLDRNILHRNAELGIFIGDKDYLSKGYGSEAVMLLLDYGFNVLNLNSIMLKVLSFNTRAIKSYEKCGFKEFGRRRQAMILGDRKFDSIYMDILAEDFTGTSFVDEIIEKNK